MRTYRRLVIAGCATALLLALFAPSASANRLRISWKFFKVEWGEVTFSAAESSVRCALTVHGSFREENQAKLPHFKFGDIDRVTIGACRGGTVTALTETLPWRISYEAFIGRLPQIAGVWLLLGGLRFRIDPEGALPACLANATEPSAAFGIAEVSSGNVTGLRLDETVGIPLRGELLCEFAGEGRVSGTGRVTREESAIGITIRLI